jgi:DmsE family decaheme c-type cytochrome
MKRRFLKGSCFMVVGWAVLLGMAQAGEVDWAGINPAFARATYVKDKQICAGCHEESMAAYQHTEHARIFEYGPKGALEARDCEACHGPRSEHVENPDAGLAMTGEHYSAVCLQCHNGGDRLYWQSSLHNAAHVNCTSCHTVMEKKSNRALLAAADEPAVCYSCHTNVRAQMQKSYHHPVREGRIDCSGCHNVHGSPGRGMLAKGTVNETCYSCHQEKRGPFLWEHPPVRENCLNCHEPHGSNNRDLQITQGAAQCVTCHQYGGHINQYRYNRVSTPYGKGCVNCHLAVHGSNHPSGAKFNR